MLEREKAAVSAAASSSLNKNIINRINITAMLSDDNASDEENGHEDLDTSTSSIPTIRVRFHKPQTAPQFQRMPLFASNDLDALMDKQQASLLSTSQDLSPRSPHRPSSSRPQSRSNPVAAHKKNVSVENRVLLKLASVLPSGEHALGRLPESRANLVKLNAELDAAIKEVRDLETVQSKFSFGMSSAGNALPEDAAVSSMEHGAVVYDAIIAELTAQAAKKVGRIRRFYGGYLLRVRNAHSEEVAALQLRIEQLEPERHEAVLLQMPKDGLLLDSFSASERIEQPHSTNEAGATDPPASPGRGGLHDFVLSRLTKERKVSHHAYNTHPSYKQTMEANPSADGPAASTGAARRAGTESGRYPPMPSAAGGSHSTRSTASGRSPLL